MVLCKVQIVDWPYTCTVSTVKLWECEAARTKSNGILEIEKLYKRDLCFRYTLPRVGGGFSRTVGHC